MSKEVSRRVNSVRNNGANLQDPPDDPSQLRLL
jgi:hypothetical protein